MQFSTTHDIPGKTVTENLGENYLEKHRWQCRTV